MTGFPFVVRHKKLGWLGVAFKSKMNRGIEYYSVSNIQSPPGVSTYGFWSKNMVVSDPDMTPESLGWKPKKKVSFYVRNTITGTVGRVYSDTNHNGVPAWGIEHPDGRKTSRWFKRTTVEISKAEYDRLIDVKPKASRPAPKKTGTGRRCKTCGMEIMNGNWWYCAKCDQSRRWARRNHEFSNSNKCDPR